MDARHLLGMEQRYRLVEALNARQARDALNAIISVLDSVEWDAGTVDEVARAIRERVGWTPPEAEEWTDETPPRSL